MWREWESDWQRKQIPGERGKEARKTEAAI